VAHYENLFFYVVILTRSTAFYHDENPPLSLIADFTKNVFRILKRRLVK